MKKNLLLLVLAFSIKAMVLAQCIGFRNWPTLTYQAPNTVATPTQISLPNGNPSNQSGDYFHVTGFITGYTYHLQGTNGNYFTLTELTSNGPVAFYGSSLTFTQPSTNSGNYYIHFFYDNTCTADFNGYGVAVQLVSTGGTLPTLTTTQPIIVSSSTATCGGNITNAGSSAVVGRGVCWSNSPNPTTSNYSVNIGSGAGVFSQNVTNFVPNLTYHMRAWATNSTGIAYGNDVVFTTTTGCLGSTNYPTGVQNGPGVNGQTVNITQTTGNCNYSGDYFDVALSTGNYTFNSSNVTDYFTITDLNNALILYATQPLIVTVSVAGTFRVHINADANCLVDNICRGISITRTGGSQSSPTVSTTAASSIGAVSAVSGGNVSSAGSGTVTTRGVCYSTTANPTTSNSKVSSGSGTGVFTANIGGLSPNTTYHTRAYATSGVGTSYGSDLTFTTTSSSLPIVTTDPVTYVSTGMASGGGNVTSAGSDTIISAGVCYSTSVNPTIANLTIVSSFSVGPLSVFISGLVTGTTYHFRAFATTAAGTGYGADVVYTAIQKATVTSTSATAITSSSATVGGNVTNTGSTSVTARGICYSTSTNPTIANSTVTSGSGVGSFTANLSGLTPSTFYYAKAFASNAAGTAYGNQITFTTNSPNAIQELSSINSIQVYPNPFGDELTIKVMAALNHSKYSLSNPMGMQVLVGYLDGETTHLNLEKLTSGIYYLNLAGSRCIKISKK